MTTYVKHIMPIFIRRLAYWDSIKTVVGGNGTPQRGRYDENTMVMVMLMSDLTEILATDFTLGRK